MCDCRKRPRPRQRQRLPKNLILIKEDLDRFELWLAMMAAGIEGLRREHEAIEVAPGDRSTFYLPRIRAVP